MSTSSSRDLEIAAAQANKTKRISVFEKGVNMNDFTRPTGIAIPELNVHFAFHLVRVIFALISDWHSCPSQMVAVPHLSEYLSDLPSIRNHIIRTKVGPARPGMTYNQEIDHNENVILDLMRTRTEPAVSLLRAGPRRNLIWQQGEVKAAIVTCGGLCPGLNSVICELVNMLYFNYGVDEIFGIRMGLRGFYESQYLPYKRLTPESVDGISKRGGTCLGSSRGGFEADKILNACISNGINQGTAVTLFFACIQLAVFF
jgi:hypothetical protein